MSDKYSVASLPGVVIWHLPFTLLSLLLILQGPFTDIDKIQIIVPVPTCTQGTGKGYRAVGSVPTRGSDSFR